MPAIETPRQGGFSISGICGFVNFDGAPVNSGILQAMVKISSHRGPDGICCWTNESGVGFAHLALNATPESLRENQPLCSRDGLICLTADARVDNRKDLIAVLSSKGYFHDPNPTDADLILAAYHCWEIDAPQHVIGDYAFAIWDGVRQKLFCARDALGARPFHYTQAGATFCFASEAQQILQHPAVPWRLDEVAMGDYLVNNCLDDERSMFAPIHRLPPAHRLIAGRHGLRIEAYWWIDPEFRIFYRNETEYAEHFRELFTEAVRARLRTHAGVVGTQFSGGIESPSVAAVAQHILTSSNTSPRLVAFSYAFDRLKECDERPYSQPAAAALGIDINYINAEHFWLLEDAEAFRPTLETPFLGWESLGRHLFSLLEERGGRVLLTGHGTLYCRPEGSDLLPIYRLFHGQMEVLRELADYAKERHIFFPRLMIGALVGPLLPGGGIRKMLIGKWINEASRVPSWVRRDFANRIGLAERVLEPSGLCCLLTLLQHRASKHVPLLETLNRGISWYDRVASLYGIEARHPFLDRRLFEYTYAIPPEQIHRFGSNRDLLRKAMKDLVPDVVRLRQKKTTFFAYMARSVCRKAKDVVQDLMTVSRLAKLGMVDQAEFQRAFFRACLEDINHVESATLWFPLTMEMWLRRYLPVEESSCEVTLASQHDARQPLAGIQKASQSLESGLHFHG